MSEFDRGPPAQLAQLFDGVPDPPVKGDFWFDWGPVFYRGRLDGSARVLCVASDPGPTERIAARIRSPLDGDPCVLLVAESGIRTVDDVERVRCAGANAILVGESLMKEEDIGAKIRELLAETR